jgi:hypothetical protein
MRRGTRRSWLSLVVGRRRAFVPRLSSLAEDPPLRGGHQAAEGLRISSRWADEMPTGVELTLALGLSLIFLRNVRVWLV